MSPPFSPPPGGHDDADQPEATLLSFHGDIVDELLERDGLTVMAEGLGLTTVLAGLLRAHALESGAAPARSPGSDALALAPVDPAPPSESGGGAVLLLGVSDAQKLALRLHLRRVAPWVAFPPEVTAEFAGNDRKQLYHRGGPMFVTTRIATVDMLAERLPPSRVAGLVIASAHRVTEFSGEAFAVRLFRAGNRRGFVRALTDRPGDLVRGFNTVERAMKSLMVRTLNLWPRFHLRARACLDAHAPEVVELRQPLTASARKIQDALVDVMRACMDELKRSRHVDTSELTLEAGLHR
jgi:DNA excision repair protein ERCC-4